MGGWGAVFGKAKFWGGDAGFREARTREDGVGTRIMAARVTAESRTAKPIPVTDVCFL